VSARYETLHMAHAASNRHSDVGSFVTDTLRTSLCPPQDKCTALRTCASFVPAIDKHYTF
jgi:hypothetical protein